MMLEVRPATRADLDAVLEISDLPEREAPVTRWIDKGQCYVADDGRILGFAVMTRDFFQSAFIELLAVAPDQRRRGLGTAIVEYCDRRTANEKLFTSTNQSNVSMQGLLEKLGFIPTGILENLDEGDPELFYVRLPRS
jgi:ribosomal protein S18 acetylase RimI-like enzyme